MHRRSTPITPRPLAHIESMLPLTATLSCLLTVHDRIGDYRFGQLLECIDFNWYAVSVTNYPAGNFPHFKVILESDVNGDDRLLRGEIITITDIMAARLRTKTLRPHIVAPVRLPMVDSRILNDLLTFLVDSCPVSHGSSSCPCPRG